MLTDPTAPRRGTWRVDDESGELVEFPRADAYADQVEAERRLMPEPPVRRIVRL